MFLNLKSRATRLLSNEDDGRVCEDISEQACVEQPKNHFIHVASLAMTKLGDGLVDPKLVLSSLLLMLGTPVYILAWLVPIREAGALLPQLFTAAYIRSMPVRKYVWAFGAAIQGFCVLTMGLGALYFDGIDFGYVVISSLVIFSLARSLCSVSYKDVLGKTIEKRKRGATTGAAGSFASALMIFFAIIIVIDFTQSQLLLIIALFTASSLWFIASLLFVQLQEEPGATSGGGNPISEVIKHFTLLSSDRQLLLFIITRAFLLATALAPPFIVALVYTKNTESNDYLGYMLLASSLAGLLSSYVWGRLSDKDSRMVLVLSAAISLLVFITLSVLIMNNFRISLTLASSLLFFLLIAYQGVRVGRSTHLVDMASQDKRASYTALSNTIIGILLLFAGGLSFVVESYGSGMVFGLFSIMSFAAIVTGLKLNKVQ